MPVSELICPSCGESHLPGTQFCTSCNAYLAWELTMLGSEPLVRTDQPGTRQPSDLHGRLDERTMVIRESPRSGPSSRIPTATEQAQPSTPTPPLPPEAGPPPPPARPVQLFKAVIEPESITVMPGGPAVAISVRVFNLCSVVDGFTVDLISAPAFLKVAAVEVRLLPDTDETVSLAISLPATPMVSAGVHDLTVGVRSSTHVGVQFNSTVVLTIGVVDGPITLSLEPSLVRARDTDSAQLRLVAENVGGNRPVPLVLEGSDPERLVRFIFSPPVLTVPAGGTAAAQLRLMMPPPDPGQEVSRQVTITASEGTREVTVGGTFVLLTSSRELRLSLEPSLVKVRDTGRARLRLLVTNPTGSAARQLALRGSDPERAVRFTFTPPALLVPAGGTAIAAVDLDAAEPEPGQEVSRILTITAGMGGDQAVINGTLIQSSSPVALSAWLEPSLIRVRDSLYGQTQVVVDNRGSRRPLTLSLSGSDPEGVVRFTFNPPVLTIRPGDIAAARLLMEAPPPEDGRDVSRALTIHASAGERTFDAIGSFQQSSSAPAISALTLRLDPSVIRVHDSSDSTFDVVADNRNGHAPVQVHLEGSDPERIVQFAFEPVALNIEPGGWAVSRVRLRAPRPDRGQEVNRQIKIAASDDRRTVETTGSYIQFSSDRRPLIRALLTVIGGMLMTAGVFYPWTTLPEKLNGIEWTLLKFSEAIHLDLSKINVNIPQLRHVTAAFQSGGLLVFLFTALTLFGLTGSEGRLIRAGSALSLLFIVAFSVAFTVRADSWSVGIGAILVGLGSVVAFIGGLYSRR